MVMLSINSTVVAFPQIAADLDVAPVAEQFLVTAYALVFGALLLLGARIGDVLGRRRVLVAGTAMFAVASIIGAAAPVGGLVIAARAGQGLGAACVAPTALAMLAAMFPAGGDRDRGLGVLAAATAAGAAGGVLLGGLLSATLGWRSIFVVVAAASAVLSVLAARWLPSQVGSGQDRSLDVLGAVLATAGIGSLVLGIAGGGEPIWQVMLLGSAAVLLVGFVYVERHARSPLLPLTVFRLWSATTATAATVLIWAGFASLFFHVSLLLQEVFSYSSLATGLAYLPLSAISVLSSRCAGGLVTRCGPRLVVLGGSALIAAGSFLLSRAEAGDSFAVVLPGLLAAGAGLGAALVALQSAAFSDVPRPLIGPVSGLFTTAQEVASAVGTAALVAVALTQSERPAGLQLALVAGAGIALAGGVLFAATAGRQVPPPASP